MEIQTYIQQNRLTDWATLSQIFTDVWFLGWKKPHGIKWQTIIQPISNWTDWHLWRPLSVQRPNAGSELEIEDEGGQ